MEVQDKMHAWKLLIEEINQAKNDMGNPKVIWFRGHSDESWTLTPSLFRYSNGLEKEKEIYYKFDQLASNIIKQKTSSWETLFDMQHYYIPTRLLDWTETLGVALYFAIMGRTNINRNSCVWLLNPLKLNKITTGKDEVKRCDNKNFNYQKIYWDKIPIKPIDPIALEPPFRNDRIKAQQGMFTIHGDSDKCISMLHPDTVTKIIIPVNALKDVQDFLDYAHINPYSIFPDIEGLAPFLKSITGLI